jgi:hypothetical protein
MRKNIPWHGECGKSRRGKRGDADELRKREVLSLAAETSFL